MAVHEITLYGIIGQRSWWDDDDTQEITDQAITTALNKIPLGEDVRLLINSIGGSVQHGNGIYSILNRYKAKARTFNKDFKLQTVNEAYAYSAAGVIFMAGDERIMNEGSVLMVHNAWTYAAGNAKELQKMGKDLEVVDAAIREIFIKVTGLKEDEIVALLDDETYMTGKEARKLNFATEESKDKAATNRLAKNYGEDVMNLVANRSPYANVLMACAVRNSLKKPSPQKTPSPKNEQMTKVSELLKKLTA